MKKLTKKQYENECADFMRKESMAFFRKLIKLHDKGVELGYDEETTYFLSHFNSMALDLTSISLCQATSFALESIAQCVAKSIHKETGKNPHEEEISGILTSLIVHHPFLKEKLINHSLAMLIESGEGVSIGIPQQNNVPESFPSYVG